MRISGTHIALGAAALLVAFGSARLFFARGADDATVSLSAEELSSRARGEAPDGARTGSADRVSGPSGPATPKLEEILPSNNYGADSPVEFEPPTRGGDPNTPTPEEARAVFDAAIEELDLAISGELVLSIEDEQRIYAQVTGSFEVLTAHVSRNNPEQMAFVETAHAEMLQKLREAEVMPARPGANERPERASDRHRGFRVSRRSVGG